MKYAVMTTWKHTNAIDWDDAEASIGDDLPEGKRYSGLRLTSIVTAHLSLIPLRKCTKISRQHLKSGEKSKLSPWI